MLRRDVQVVCAAVLVYNAWAELDQVQQAGGLSAALGGLVTSAVLLTAATAANIAVRASRTWTAAASVLVAGVVLCTAVTVVSILTGALTPLTPLNAVLIAVMTVVVLHLHAQLPLVLTACVTLAWTAASTGAVALAPPGPTTR